MARITEANRKLYSERLLTLANLLRTLESNQYNHRRWVEKYKPREICSTKACAFGWAACDKRLFPDLPVKPVNIGSTRCPDWRLSMIEGSRYCNEPFIAEQYFGPDSYNSIFSGIAFGCDARPATPKKVADRIDDFVREKYGYERA